MALQFKIKMAPAIATAIVLPILLSLGFWQLDRAEIKQQILEQYNRKVTQPAVQLSSADKLAVIKPAEIQYANIQATGHYDTEHSFLIDNRVHESQVGFYVITPFIIENTDKAVLVNRGWIKANKYRSELPKFSTNSDKMIIRGQAYLPSRNFFSVDNVKIESQVFPVIIQNIDFAALSEVIMKNVYPFVMRLDPEDKSGFVRDWKVITSSPQKSQSYAAQWFTMALVVVLLFLHSSIKVNREKTA